MYAKITFKETHPSITYKKMSENTTNLFALTIDNTNVITPISIQAHAQTVHISYEKLQIW